MPGVLRRVVRWGVRGAARSFAGAVGVVEDMVRSLGALACRANLSPKIAANFFRAAVCRPGMVSSSPLRREIAFVRVRARRECL